LLHALAIHGKRFTEGGGHDRPLIVVQFEGVGSLDRFADHAVIVDVCSQVNVEDASGITLGGIDELVDRMAALRGSLSQGAKADRMGLLGGLDICGGALQVIPSNLGGKFVGRLPGRVHTRVHLAGGVQGVDGDEVDGDGASGEPREGLISEFAPSDGVFDDGAES